LKYIESATLAKSINKYFRNVFGFDFSFKANCRFRNNKEEEINRTLRYYL